MRNLKIFIVSFTSLILSGCVLTPSMPRFDDIPKGIHCLLLKKPFCINEETKEEYSTTYREIRGYEAVPMDYKKELEFFIADILEENAKLRIECGSK